MTFYDNAAAAERYFGLRWLRAVWNAVLVQAIEDVVRGPADFELKGLAPVEACAYISSVKEAAALWIGSDVDTLQSFVWVCECLNLDPAVIRRGVGRKVKAHDDAS